MITVSLVRELGFMSLALNQKVEASIKIGEYPPMQLSIEKSVLSVFFLNKLIWQESISEPSSSVGNFGVESCDTILRIMKMETEGKNWSVIYPHIHV